MDKKTAQSAYRDAWRHYLMTPSGTARNQLQEIMDDLHECCVDGKPGTEWEDFVKTLPGYVEHWEALDQDLNKTFSDVFPGEKL